MSTVEVRALELPAPMAFIAMTFPAYRHLLSFDDKSTRHVDTTDNRWIRPLALAAWHGNVPVGLVLAELPVTPDGTAPQLLSMFVDPKFRDQGVGTALVNALETLIRERGFAYVEAVYMTGRPGTEAIERVLAKRGWSPPVTRTLTVRFFPAMIAAQDWFPPVLNSAPECEVFPWTELTEEQRAEIRRTNQEDRWIPPGREPWEHDLDGFEKQSSVGLRFQGAVIGWVINHMVADDMVRFSCAFAREGEEAPNRFHALMAHSIQRAAGAGIKLGTFVTPLEESELSRLLAERCPEAFEFIGETRVSVRWLDDDASTMGA